jgi:hypothetical protein
MARRVFISYQHDDRMKAKGFNLLRWNKNVEVEFVGRHLLDPVDSKNEDYIKQCVREQLNGTSVTVVLIGKNTPDSDWVRWEIEESVSKESPNGVLAIKLELDCDVPSDSPVGKILHDIGAEIMDWSPHDFADALERAALAAGRIRQVGASVGAPGGGCGR